MNEIWLAGEALGLGLIQDFALACKKTHILGYYVNIGLWMNYMLTVSIVTKACVEVIDYNDNRI